MITEQEFLDFIAGFDEDNLSNDDLLAIGIKHKELPLGVKNWNSLNDKLGSHFANGESYRCWVKEALKAKGELPKNVKMLSDATIDQLSDEDISQELEKQKVELYKQQIKTRDAQREYRSLMRTDARRENLIDTLYDLLKNEEPIQLGHINRVDGNKEGVLILSDWHIGCVVQNFYNKFDLDVAIQRIETLRDYVINYCKQFKIGKLNIINLGDTIENEIHVTARVTNEMNTVGQIKKAAELISALLADLSCNIKEIVYRSIQGNHDRVIQDYKQSLDDDNFNTLIDDMVQMKVELAGIKNVEFDFNNLGDSFGLVRLNNGKLLGYTHGDKINIDRAYQAFTGAIKDHIDYVVLGHRHNSCSKEFNAAKMIAAGSLKGTDEYALTKNLFSRPSQTMLVFDGNADVNITINLD